MTPPCNCEQALALKALLTRVRDEFGASRQAVAEEMLFGRPPLLLAIDEALKPTECADADCSGFHADDNVEPYPTPADASVKDSGPFTPERLAALGREGRKLSAELTERMRGLHGPHDQAAVLTAEVVRLKVALAEADADVIRTSRNLHEVIDKLRAERDQYQAAYNAQCLASVDLVTEAVAGVDELKNDRDSWRRVAREMEARGNAAFAERDAARGEVDRLREALRNIVGQCVLSAGRNMICIVCDAVKKDGYIQDYTTVGDCEPPHDFDCEVLAARAALQPAPVQVAAPKRPRRDCAEAICAAGLLTCLEHAGKKETP